MYQAPRPTPSGIHSSLPAGLLSSAGLGLSLSELDSKPRVYAYAGPPAAGHLMEAQWDHGRDMSRPGVYELPGREAVFITDFMPGSPTCLDLQRYVDAGHPVLLRVCTLELYEDEQASYVARYGYDPSAAKDGAAAFDNELYTLLDCATMGLVDYQQSGLNRCKPNHAFVIHRSGDDAVIEFNESQVAGSTLIQKMLRKLAQRGYKTMAVAPRPYLSYAIRRPACARKASPQAT